MRSISASIDANTRAALTGSLPALTQWQNDRTHCGPQNRDRECGGDQQRQRRDELIAM